MKVVVDTTVLIFFFDGTAAAPVNTVTGMELEGCQARVNYLVKSLSDRGTTIVIPTPVLAEILVKAGSATNEWIARITRNRFIEVADFDIRAAVEFAAVYGARPKSADEEKRKMKFDDQILAISRVANAEVIYSADVNLGKKVASWQRHISLFDLPLPPENPQKELAL